MTNGIRPQASYPCTTLWQPWASLVSAGCKPFEFRRWEAPRYLVGRRVAIHAGTRPPKVAEIRALLVKLHSATWRETGLARDVAIPQLERWKLAPSELPTGSVLCLATMGVPIRNAELAERLGIGGYAEDGPGRINDSDKGEQSMWGWPLYEVEPLTPLVPARGQQGWWTWRPSAHG